MNRPESQPPTEGKALNTQLADRLLLLASMAGLLPAGALAIVRAVGENWGNLWELAPGHLAFGLVYASPYVVGLAIWWRRIAGRLPHVLLGITLLSLVASFSALSGVSLVLFPATVLLGIATVRAFRKGGYGRTKAVALSVIAMAASVVIVASFFTMFMREDARCARFIEYADGRVVTLPMPVPPGGPGGPIHVPPSPEGVVSQGARCTSDIITPVEALAGLGLLAVGLITFAGLGRYSASVVSP